MKRLRKFIAYILSLTMLLSIVNPTMVLAAGDGNGEYNNTTDGGTGPYHMAAINVKVDFFKPKQMGLSAENNKMTDQGKVYWDPKDGTDNRFSSLIDLAVYKRSKGEYTPGQKLLSQQPMQVKSGGIDSAKYSQLYATPKPGEFHNRRINFGPVNILFERTNTYAEYESHGMEIINANRVNGAGDGHYKSAWGLFTLQNEIYHGFCEDQEAPSFFEETNNGAEWDVEGIKKVFNYYWDKRVAPGANIGPYNSDTWTRLRRDVCSMFYSQRNLDVISADWNDFFNNQIKENKKPPGMSVEITSKQQATNIKNLVLLTFAMVMGNPCAGLEVNGQTIGPWTTYKGDAYKNSLLKWIEDGGNCDTSENMMAIKFESYAVKHNASTGKAFAERYDVAFYNSTTGLRPNMTSPNIGLNTFYLNRNASSNNDKLEIERRTVDTILEYAKQNGASVSGNSAMADSVSPWSIFQQYRIKNNKTHDNKSTFSFRWVNEAVHRDKGYKGDGIPVTDKTQNIGFSYWWASGANPGITNGAAERPNFKMDDAISAPEGVIVPDGENPIVRNDFSLMAATPNNDVLGNKLPGVKFIIDGDEWRQTNTEVGVLLNLIDRCIVTGENSQLQGSGGTVTTAAGVRDRAKLPVEITIKRTLEGHYINDRDKLFDEFNESEVSIANCGNHDFEIIDNGDVDGTATIVFNIIPDGNCGGEHEFTYVSPIKAHAGVDDDTNTISNCFISQMFKNNLSPIKFIDKEIQMENLANLEMKVHYDFTTKIYSPTFKENKELYGDNVTDKQRQVTEYNAKGHAQIPNSMGNTYPLSDYANGTKQIQTTGQVQGDTGYETESGYTFSNTIRRSILLKKAPETPYYTNMGYENITPYRSEIKAGTPGNEEFEAMAGTPTTEDLFVSVGATEFRINFDAHYEAVPHGESYRIFTFHMEGECKNYPGYKCSNCIHKENCTSTDPEHKCHECSGHDSKNPYDCEWNAEIKIPISSFNYFDMNNSETWMLTKWGLNGGEEFLNGDDYRDSTTHAMQTFIAHLNTGKYDGSPSGRFVFSDSDPNCEHADEYDGQLCKFHDCYYDAGICSSNYCNASEVGEECTTSYVVAEAFKAWRDSLPDFEGYAVSDFCVMKTSEGYQIPYFQAQKFKEVASPSTAPDWKPDSHTDNYSYVVETSRLTVEEPNLDINQLWWEKEEFAATKDRGWTEGSIVYAGYNGKYNEPYEKYSNRLHQDFTYNSSPYEDMMNDLGLDPYLYYGGGNHIMGSGEVEFGVAENNNEHIIRNLDFKGRDEESNLYDYDYLYDTVANGEYDTGKSWLEYRRNSLHIKNVDKSSSTEEVNFKVSGADGDGTYYKLDSVPYHEETNKINDIVVHDPVAAEYAIVVSNDEQYDDRTNAELIRGGDPVGLIGGVCPEYGCEYSTLWNDIPGHYNHCVLSPHTDSCYEEVTEVKEHHGGFNTHDCSLPIYIDGEPCTHVHTSECYSIPYTYTLGNYYRWENYTITNGTIVYEYHDSLSPAFCTQCHDRKCKYIDHNGSKIEAVCICDDHDSLFGRGDPWCYCNDPDGPGWFDNDDWDGCDAICPMSPEQWLICGKEQKHYAINNTHTCNDGCVTTTEKRLICTDPHHYEPGDPHDEGDEKYHYPVGDPRCWKRCGDDQAHGTKMYIDVPEQGSATPQGTFINIDREFKIYYPFKGDFAEDPSLFGIAETTSTRGKGYENKMDTIKWTHHRWVSFPVNVIGPDGKMYLSNTDIDLNTFSREDEVFTFYAVLANSEYAAAETKFTSTSFNAPYADKDSYFDDSNGETNKERTDPIYAARHTAHKYQYIDVVGYIGGLTLHDVGDFRFANFFKYPLSDSEPDPNDTEYKYPDSGEGELIPNLVGNVNPSKPRNILSDDINVRRDLSTQVTSYLDVYGHLYQFTGGKSGGVQNGHLDDPWTPYPNVLDTAFNVEPKNFPLTPYMNNIKEFRNQPMRAGYQLYMDVETVGDYHGETIVHESSHPESFDPDEDNIETGEVEYYPKLSDFTMNEKVQVRPVYYSLDLLTGEYTPVDVYYSVNNEFVKVNNWKLDVDNLSDMDTSDYNYYLDWLDESVRRNYTDAESLSTTGGVNWRNTLRGIGSDDSRKGAAARRPNNTRDVEGTANVLMLNDLDRTYIGSERTYGILKNPEFLIGTERYNSQAQRWHITLGLPSSSVFVRHGVEPTEETIKELQKPTRVIVGTIDIKARGTVWTLEYDGSVMNGNRFRVYDTIIDEHGNEVPLQDYGPPSFTKDGTPYDPMNDDPDNPDDDDVTSGDPVIVIYDSTKTSKDDVYVKGTH